MAHDGIGNTGAGGDEPTHWEAAKMALTDWRTYMLVVMYMLATGSQTIQYFIPTLVSQLGYKGFMAQYMTIPIYMVALVGILTFCFISDWRKERGNYITLTACIAGFSFIVTVAANNEHVKYAFLCFAVAGVYACCPLTLLVCLSLLTFLLFNPEYEFSSGYQVSLIILPRNVLSQSPLSMASVTREYPSFYIIS